VEPVPRAPEPSERECESILEVVARRSGLDLRDYRRSTLSRRIASRVATSGLDPVEYLRRLELDPVELERLAAELLVRVTSFFRDPAVFLRLESVVLPSLLSTSSPGELLRAWVVGAATGEEAYSLGMLLADACGAAGRAYEVLATDRIGQALEPAREGVYDEDAAAAVPARFRERFFRRDGERLQVVDHLRDRVRFSEHDLMASRLAPREAVLASFDLVLCRNMLIYFDDRYQDRACERLSTVVRVDGALVLGHVESLRPNVASRFAPFPGIEGNLRIFRRSR
jgi:two-component system CheB/CheR fusion protein